MKIEVNDANRVLIIRGKAAEFEELSEELQSWTPTNGWSRQARELFRALKGQR